MKTYFLFGGDTYYPSGGMKDLQGKFDSVEECETFVENMNFDWYQIVESDTLSIVKEV